MSPSFPEDASGPYEKRLVVHFRFALPLELDAAQPEASGSPDTWRNAVLAGVRDLDGRTSGWSDDFVTIDFPISRILDVTRLLSSATLAPELSVGVSFGNFRSVPAGKGLSLGAGEGMRQARRLSEASLPGEVLVSEELARNAGLRAVALAPRRALREVGAVSLDLETPVLESAPPVEIPSGIPEVSSDSLVNVGGDALRRYRAEKVASKKEGGLGTCRASLALAVALAQLGRENEAILESLEGLSWARETNDVRGERACALFLVQFADRRGESKLSATWAEVARSRANV